MTITLRQAYDKGRVSQRTLSDWDVAEARFSTKYCAHAVDQWCSLETAWADGWDDAQEGNRNRQPK